MHLSQDPVTDTVSFIWEGGAVLNESEHKSSNLYQCNTGVTHDFKSQFPFIIRKTDKGVGGVGGGNHCAVRLLEVTCQKSLTIIYLQNRNALYKSSFSGVI